MFSTRLKALRERHNYSQEQLAGLLSVNKQQVYRWEAGQNVPAGDVVAQIAKLFNVSADYLLGLADIERVITDLSDDEMALVEAYRLVKKRADSKLG